MRVFSAIGKFLVITDLIFSYLKKKHACVYVHTHTHRYDMNEAISSVCVCVWYTEKCVCFPD